LRPTLAKSTLQVYLGQEDHTVHMPAWSAERGL
jgi:hypothetical protein